MHDWSDNELDGMSREAAENYGPGRELPNWEALQKRLDNELPEHKENNRKRFLFLVILCLLLSGVTGYLLITQNSGGTQQKNEAVLDGSPHSNSDKKVENKKGTDANDKEAIAPVTTNNDNNSDKKNPVLDKSDNSHELSATEAQKNRQALISTMDPKNSTHYPPPNKKNISPRKEKLNGGTDQDFAVTIENGKTKTKKLSDAPETGNEKPGNASNPIGAEAIVATEAVAEPQPGNEEKKSDKTVAAKDTAAATAEVKKAPTVKSPQKNSAIEISLLAGVDVSNVKFKYSDKAGFNIGLLAGYRFNKRWAVGTGLIYTKKNYTAEGSDFKPPASYWTNIYKLDKVEGSCFMWEIPVNVFYHFNTTRKSGWYVGMGVSSYFMNKEDYTYYYKYMNGNPGTRYWQNSDPSNYWFSILGISAGWEKNLGRGLSLGVSPYAKLPLKGVGFGNMQLSSYGVNLVLTYRKATGVK